MDLTYWEEMLITATRKAREAPGNVMLWYTVGLRDAAEKIKDIDPERCKRDLERIRVFDETYKEFDDKYES